METTLPPTAIGLSRVAAHRAAVKRRQLLVIAFLATGTSALFVLTMTLGSYVVPPVEILLSALRLGDDPSIDFIVQELRLPTALTALAVGIALGVSGLIFQTLLANPLASPDFVGVSSGASLFAVAGIVFFNFGSFGVSLAALGGALVSTALVYLLAWRDGITGYRFILIGIGISQFMLSLAGYVIAKAEIYSAREAATWLVGSVGRAGGAQINALIAALAILLPCVALLGRMLRTVELGDDVARGLGIRVEHARGALVAVAIALVAFATAAAGPIMFVALVAGPIARRLIGAATGATIAAALVGANIVLGADLIANHAFPVLLPTGVITGLVGAPYLVWLLATANREGRGG